MSVAEEVIELEAKRNEQAQKEKDKHDLLGGLAIAGSILSCLGVLTHDGSDVKYGVILVVSVTLVEMVSRSLEWIRDRRQTEAQVLEFPPTGTE